MKITKANLRKVIREALSQEVPELTGGRKSSFQVHKEKSMAANKAMIDDYLKQIADELIKNPDSAGDILTTFEPAIALDKHQQSLEGGLQIDAFLDKVEEDLQSYGVDRVAALKFGDSFLKFR